MTQKRPVLVIVCGYSSGAFLAQEFDKLGFDCIHITLNRLASLKAFRINQNDYIAELIVEDETKIEDCIKKLQTYHPTGIIAGCECGVLLADMIAAHFDVYKNESEISLARRDKYYMIEQLRKQGLTAQKQIKTNILSDIFEWQKQCQLDRIVLKPLKSAVSDNVYYCTTQRETEAVFQSILNEPTVYNEVNTEVLAQEFIDGTEYIVNAFSFNGKHQIIDIWQGVNNTPDLVSNDLYADLIGQSEAVHQKLGNYTKEVLTALGVKYGASHSEIRINSRGIPYLIECGVRLSGRIYSPVLEKLYGESQYSLLLKMYTDPNVICEFLKRPLSPTHKARYVYFKSNIDGLIKEDVNLASFYQIPSLVYVDLPLKKGDWLHKTCKVKKIHRPGFAYLLASTEEKIERDYHKLIELEQKTYEDIIR
ncbi:MAG: ATP-grasp domain-containing protein [Legionellales bacterium]|nr:ATP-grasp domain-containing protein [Legionellales bacterium]